MISIRARPRRKPLSRVCRAGSKRFRSSPSSRTSAYQTRHCNLVNAAHVRPADPHHAANRPAKRLVKSAIQLLPGGYLTRETPLGKPSVALGITLRFGGVRTIPALLLLDRQSAKIGLLLATTHASNTAVKIKWDAYRPPDPRITLQYISKSLACQLVKSTGRENCKVRL